MYRCLIQSNVIISSDSSNVEFNKTKWDSIEHTYFCTDCKLIQSADQTVDQCLVYQCPQCLYVTSAQKFKSDSVISYGIPFQKKSWTSMDCPRQCYCCPLCSYALVISANSSKEGQDIKFTCTNCSYFISFPSSPIDANNSGSASSGIRINVRESLSKAISDSCENKSAFVKGTECLFNLMRSVSSDEMKVKHKDNIPESSTASKHDVQRDRLYQIYKNSRDNTSNVAVDNLQPKSRDSAFLPKPVSIKPRMFQRRCRNCSKLLVKPCPTKNSSKSTSSSLKVRIDGDYIVKELSSEYLASFAILVMPQDHSPGKLFAVLARNPTTDSLFLSISKSASCVSNEDNLYEAFGNLNYSRCLNYELITKSLEANDSILTTVDPLTEFDHDLIYKHKLINVLTNSEKKKLVDSVMKQACFFIRIPEYETVAGKLDSFVMLEVKQENLRPDDQKISPDAKYFYKTCLLFT